MARGKIADNPNTKLPIKKESDIIKTRRAKNIKFDYKFVKMASRLMASGVRQKDLAFVMGVHPQTISNWKAKYPVFRKALEDGKEMAVSGLINTGLRAATGYEIEETTTEYVKDRESGEWVEIKKRVVSKQRDPNPSLLMFFLTNLAPEQFKKRVEVDSRSMKVSLNGDDIKHGIQELAGKLSEIDVTDAVDAEFEPENEC